MAGLIDDLKGSIDSVLSVRDQIGAVLQPVFIVTRTWYKDKARTIPASEAGGYARDADVRMLPSPGIKNLALDDRAREGGVFKQGDILLTNVSGNSYTEDDLSSVTDEKNVERLFLVGDVLYTPVRAIQKYVTWDVLLRPLARHTRYP